MTADEFRLALADLGMSQTAVARELGLSPLTVNRWQSGWIDPRTLRSPPVPNYVAAWVRLKKDALLQKTG